MSGASRKKIEEAIGNKTITHGRSLQSSLSGTPGAKIKRPLQLGGRRFIHKILGILVPGGGLEPPTTVSGLRILSPFSAVLQGFAGRRIISYKPLEMNRQETPQRCTESHRVAQK
jgi:hypothetical protein